MINDNVVVTVLAVDRNHVKIGVKAPRNIAVHRQEIYVKVKAEERGERPPYVKDVA
jgi:carbon storage regulator